MCIGQIANSTTRQLLAEINPCKRLSARPHLWQAADHIGRRVIKLAARKTLPRVGKLYKGTLGQRPRARRAAAHVRSPVKLSAAGGLAVACADRRRIRVTSPCFQPRRRRRSKRHRRQPHKAALDTWPDAPNAGHSLFALTCKLCSPQACGMTMGYPKLPPQSHWREHSSPVKSCVQCQEQLLRMTLLNQHPCNGLAFTARHRSQPASRGARPLVIMTRSAHY